MTTEALQNRYQKPLFGRDTEPEDAARYSEQHKEILALMKDGVERSSLEINLALGYGAMTRSDSRLRDLRKPQFGAWSIASRRCTDGVWRYSLRLPKERA